MKFTIWLTLLAALCWGASGCQDNRGPTAASKDSSNPKGDMGKFKFSQESFGKLSGGPEVTEFTVTNPSGATLKMIDYGATIVSLEVPDKDGNLANVNLGLKTPDEYDKNTAHFGATIGRYGNRIAKGKFKLDGKEYSLAINNPPNHLHGGPKGFDHVMWKGEEVESTDAMGIKFTYVSKDGDENYPGTLTATATYWLTKANALTIDYEATTDKDTIVNLTNHAYWNLAGSGDILDEELMIAADKYLPVNESLIPTGKMTDVKDDPAMDFTSPKKIGPGVTEMKKKAGKTDGVGYDHCYVLRSQDGKQALAAKVTDPKSGRTMEVLTDQPGIQFYSGNFLDGGPLVGGNKQHAALCLETQHYPDSPNQPEFPSTVLKPGDTYKTSTTYKFGVQ